MQKPNNYDSTPTGDFTPVELGGHKLIIKKVEETKSKNGKDMVVVYFDFAADDKQPGYFAERFRNDIRPDKKWPNQATHYIMVNDSEGNTNRSFKVFTTCVENSNDGFTLRWGIDNWGAQFKDKKVGGVFGEQLDFYEGKEKKNRVLRWFCSFNKTEDLQIPEITETQAYKSYKNGGFAGDGFADISNDDDMPF